MSLITDQAAAKLDENSSAMTSEHLIPDQALAEGKPREGDPLTASVAPDVPSLPEAIKARIRTAAIDLPAPMLTTYGPTGLSLRLQHLRQRLPGKVQGALRSALAGARGVVADRLPHGRPVWPVLGKISVPRLSPELREGLVKHGRRAGINIGTTIDKIIRVVPVAQPGPASATTGRTEIAVSDITTVSVQRAVKQPSVFAPGHILTALLAGGIIHIATTFAITALGTGSAFRQLRAVLPANSIVVLASQSPATQLLPFLSPDMLYAMCRFDLGGGSVEVKAVLPEIGWSLALYTRAGDNFYATPGQSQRAVPVAFTLSAASDRIASLTPGVRKTDVDLGQVTSPDTEGLVVIRAPIKGVAFEGIARAIMKRASCSPAQR